MPAPTIPAASMTLVMQERSRRRTRNQARMDQVLQNRSSISAVTLTHLANVCNREAGAYLRKLGWNRERPSSHYEGASSLWTPPEDA